MTGSDSARLQPPIRVHLDGGHKTPPVSGTVWLPQCPTCGQPPNPHVIAGPDLVSNIKAMSEFAGRLLEIQDLRIQADVHPHYATAAAGLTWAQLYEAKVAELTDEIGEIRMPEGES